MFQTRFGPLIGCLFVAAGGGSARALDFVQQIAPGVHLAGFADRYGSANCGWIELEDRTVLIDLPHGIGVEAFLAAVARTSSKPVRSLLLTSEPDPEDEMLRSLRARGVGVVDVSEARRTISFGNGPRLIEAIPCGDGRKTPAVAFFLPRERILFAGRMVIHGPRADLPGRDTRAWMATLRKLKQLGARRVVPGFGSWEGEDVLGRQMRYLAELRRQVAYGISLGLPLQEIGKRILLPASYYAWPPYGEPAAEDIEHLFREQTVPEAPFGRQGPPGRGQGAQALVLIGDRFHEPEHIQAGLQPVFEATGVTPHFAVDARVLSAENLARVRLLVVLKDGMLWPEGNDRPYRQWMTMDQQKAVVEFVEAGGGFLNLHNSMGLYPEGPYLDLVGGRYKGHGPLERFGVEVVDAEHPVTRGVTGFFVADEQHTPSYDSQKVGLLLRNRSDQGKVAAAGWAYQAGRGRLCHLANGHTRESLDHPMFQRLMRNAIKWCLAGPGPR
ncbi:MAG: ThuA domain-containing protein [Acidobacteria bacterium]|nr:ThuA domain-containing protein [Acidobacteriota bacterium]